MQNLNSVSRRMLMAAAAGALLTISGCATTESRLTAAAEVQGKASVKTQIPEQPADCRKHMVRVTPKEGDKARWLQARWEANADDIDRQIDGCAAFNDDIRARFAK